MYHVYNNQHLYSVLYLCNSHELRHIHQVVYPTRPLKNIQKYGNEITLINGTKDTLQTDISFNQYSYYVLHKHPVNATTLCLGEPFTHVWLRKNT